MVSIFSQFVNSSIVLCFVEEDAASCSSSSFVVVLISLVVVQHVRSFRNSEVSYCPVKVRRSNMSRHVRSQHGEKSSQNSRRGTSCSEDPDAATSAPPSSVLQRSVERSESESTGVVSELSSSCEVEEDRRRSVFVKRQQRSSTGTEISQRSLYYVFSPSHFLVLRRMNDCRY